MWGERTCLAALQILSQFTEPRTYPPPDPGDDHCCCTATTAGNVATGKSPKSRTANGAKKGRIALTHPLPLSLPFCSPPEGRLSGRGGIGETALGRAERSRTAGGGEKCLAAVVKLAFVGALHTHAFPLSSFCQDVVCVPCLHCSKQQSTTSIHRPRPEARAGGQQEHWSRQVSPKLRHFLSHYSRHSGFQCRTFGCEARRRKFGRGAVSWSL